MTVPSRRVLLLAFHYPPCAVSSGSRRTLAFSRYLPDYGWQPLVLTARESAYERINADELAEIPRGVVVARAFALDAVRRFSLFGRYPSWLAVPDRWRSWIPFATRAGLRLIRQQQPLAIWTTYPIGSAHAVGRELQRKSGLPWIADMRDPMVEIDESTGEKWPKDAKVRAARLRIEHDVAMHSSGVVFCTEGARQIFVERYGEAAGRKTHVIANGYDELPFRQLEASLDAVPVAAATASFRLVHSGTVYPGEDRGTSQLFGAIAKLHAAGQLPPGFKLVLRATGYDALLRVQAKQCGVESLVELAPPLGYIAALREMTTADGLLLLQGRTSNPAIPAKLYEYLRARRPILALVHPEGESSALLARLNAAISAPLDAQVAIEEALRKFLACCMRGDAPIVSRSVAESYSRQSQTAALAQLLDQIVQSN